MPYLRIGFADYTLNPVERGNKSLLLDSSVCVGTVDHYEQVISYRDDLDGQAQLQTILHEVFHVADWQAQDERAGQDKENEMDRYANLLMQFIRDNREFVKLIWKLADDTLPKEKKKVKPKKKQLTTPSD